MKLIPIVIIAVGFAFITLFLLVSGYLSFELQKIAAYITIGFMAFMLLFGILAFINGGKMQKERIAEMRQLAGKWNFQFTEKPDRLTIFDQFLKALEIQRKEVNVLKGNPVFMLTGKFENKDVCIADIHYEIGGGRNRHHFNFTTIILKTEKTFPLFVCEKKVISNMPTRNFSEKYFPNQFAVTNSETFNEKYLVYGREPNVIVPIFSQSIIELLNQTKGLRIIGFGNYLCVFDVETKRYSKAEIWSRMDLLDKFTNYS